MYERGIGNELMSIPGRNPSNAKVFTSGSYPEYFVIIKAFFTEANTFMELNPIFFTAFAGILYDTVISEQRRKLASSTYMSNTPEGIV